MARIYYPVHTLGPGDRTGIWTAGCPHRCAGCMSPELRHPDNGRHLRVSEIMGIINALPQNPQGFTISGGEPFAQASELAELLCALSRLNDDIIVFTGYLYEDLVASGDAAVRTALAHCAVLIDGPYIHAQNDRKGLRGSSNQRIIVFRDHERYAELETWPRGQQGIRFDDCFLCIGIP